MRFARTREISYFPLKIEGRFCNREGNKPTEVEKKGNARCRGLAGEASSDYTNASRQVRKTDLKLIEVLDFLVDIRYSSDKGVVNSVEGAVHPQSKEGVGIEDYA